LPKGGKKNNTLYHLPSAEADGNEKKDACWWVLHIGLKLSGICSSVTVSFSQRQGTPFTSFRGL